MELLLLFWGNLPAINPLQSADNRPRKRVPSRGAAPKSRNSLPEDLPAKAFKMAQR